MIRKYKRKSGIFNIFIVDCKIYCFLSLFKFLLIAFNLNVVPEPSEWAKILLLHKKYYIFVLLESQKNVSPRFRLGKPGAWIICPIV